VVRDEGAEPATVAVIDGRLKVGLSQVELEALARTGADATKCSRRDLPFVVKGRLSGGTTVAATMIIARLVGIQVFATGGIGGVHRGGESSLDVSADLQELAKTSVAVVCAGPKAILDIGRTLEYLETHGVPVVGYQTDRLPAFYSRDSGYGVDYRLETPAQIAGLLRTKWQLGLEGGVVIANPVPSAFALDRQDLDSKIDAALANAVKEGISGKDLTPYLLQALDQSTDGKCLETNIELVLANARLAAQVAIELVAADPDRIDTKKQTT